MRYLPLTPDDRRAMLAKIGAPDIDALFRDVPREAVVPLSAFDLPDTQGRNGSRAGAGEAGGQECRGRQRAVFLRRRRLQASCAQRRWII